MQVTLGILGAGRVGSAIARTALSAGFDVAIAASGPASEIELIAELVTPGARAMNAAEAAEFADVVVVAVPLHKFRSVDPEVLRGKVVIDTMNYWEPIDGHIEEFASAGLGSSAVIHDHFAGARLVKTLNHIGYHDLELDARDAGHPERRALGIAGDDAEAVALVAQVIDRFGFDPVSTGPLASGTLLEPGTTIFGGHHTAAELRAEATRGCETHEPADASRQ